MVARAGCGGRQECDAQTRDLVRPARNGGRGAPRGTPRRARSPRAAAIIAATACFPFSLAFKTTSPCSKGVFAARRARSFSHRPSKLPFESTRTTSPSRNFASQIIDNFLRGIGGLSDAAPPERNCAYDPLRGEPFGVVQELRADSQGPSTAPSAQASATVRSFSKMRRRMVLERGSNATHSRLPGQRLRAASMVARMAVGWCAKSSTTITPPASPRICMRRATPRNVAKARSMASRGHAAAVGDGDGARAR